MKKIQNQKTMIQIMGNPKYSGKHVIMVAGKIFTAKTGKTANRILDRVEKKYPKNSIAITYIPKEDTLILWI